VKFATSKRPRSSAFETAESSRPQQSAVTRKGRKKALKGDIDKVQSSNSQLPPVERPRKTKASTQDLAGSYQPPVKKSKKSKAAIDEGLISEDQLSSVKKARKSKVLNKKEREDLITFLESMDISLIKREVDVKLNEQVFSDALIALVSKLNSAEQPLLRIITTHRQCFLGLYQECKKSTDSFLTFQLQWHQHCSAFLLSSQYPLSEINIKDPNAYDISEVRELWLSFCEENGTPVPESNPVMMTVSSAIYQFLLDHASNFQSAGFKKASPTTVQEGDDVYYRFGGAAISDMLHARYEQIKTCGNDQRDLISQEISLLHCINSKNKTNIPQYLSYRDRGYMYFPDAVFLPFLRDLDTVVTEIVNLDGLKKEGDKLIKVSLYFNIMPYASIYNYRLHMKE